MAVTKHRQKILEVLQKWFQEHDYSPTLEELCVELGRSPERRATVQRWLQTMRGQDVEWKDNTARSLHLLKEKTESVSNISVVETLRYLSTGLAQWEVRTNEHEPIPEALRIGLSRSYLSSLLDEEATGVNAPKHLPEFFDWASQPLKDWPPSKALKYLADNVRLVDDGLISDFALQWQMEGKDTERQVQESLLLDVLRHCRQYQEEEAYREFRQLIISQPVLSYRDYRRVLASPVLKPLKNFIREAYVDLSNLQADRNYQFCPRCNYPQRQRAEGSYGCRSPRCDRIRVKQQLVPLPTIPSEEAEAYKTVTPGIHRYGTIPGLWEIDLHKQISQLGVQSTLWPEIDEYDLLIDFGYRRRWAIDVKDWSYLNLERLKAVQFRSDVKRTYVVFPDANEEFLRIKVLRKRLESELGGIRLRLMSELVTEVKLFKEGK